MWVSVDEEVVCEEGLGRRGGGGRAGVVLIWKNDERQRGHHGKEAEEPP